MSDTWQANVRKLQRRRWIIWVPMALAFLAAYFHRTVTGVVADGLMRDFAIEKAAELGALASIYFYTYAVLQVPAGILADFYGPRRTFSLALLVSAFGAAIIAWTDSMAGLYVGRFLSSFGVGLLYVNIVKICAEWFRVREFGTMSGLLVFVGSAGSLLTATPLAFIVEALGWRPSFYMIAGYSFVMAVICWLAVRNRPGDIGLPSIAEVEMREGTMQALPETAKISVTAAIHTVLANRCTWWPFLVSVALYGVYMAVIGVWGMPYFMQIYGMPRVEAANYILCMAIGNMVGGPLIGVLSDRLGLRRWPYTVFAALFLGAWLMLTMWNGAKPPVWALYPICFAIGFGVSGITLNVACIKEVNSPQVTGIAAGIGNSGPFVGAAIVQPAFGWMLDRYWQGAMEHGVKIYPLSAYQNAFWLCTAVLAVGFILTLLIKETHCSNIDHIMEENGKGSWKKKESYHPVN